VISLAICFMSLIALMTRALSITDVYAGIAIEEIVRRMARTINNSIRLYPARLFDDFEERQLLLNAVSSRLQPVEKD
jgi:hypothetical protein